MQVFAVRHGKTEWNADSRIQGRSDLPLNELGRRQALETAMKLSDLDADIDLIITSPLSRALETAEIIAGHIHADIVLHDGLVERDFGDFEGLFLSDVDIDALRRWTDNVPTPNGETIRETASRVFIAMDDISERYKDHNIVIVAHGHVMRSIIWYFSGLPEDGVEQDFHIENCEVYSFQNG